MIRSRLLLKPRLLARKAFGKVRRMLTRLPTEAVCKRINNRVLLNSNTSLFWTRMTSAQC